MDVQIIFRCRGHMKKQYSIRFLLLAALAAAFTVILVFTVVYSAQSQRAHLEEYSHKYVDGLAKSFSMA